MSSYRLVSPLYLLSISLVLQLALGGNPPHYSCYNVSGNFPPNGVYNQNLDNLFTLLDWQTPLCGFASGTVGQSQNASYGLALCRGDINATACQACVDKTTAEIQSSCQFKNEAIVWNDFCQVKYSNLNFMGLVSKRATILSFDSTTASNPAYFNEKVIQFIGQLKEIAHVTPKLYAAGALDIGNSTTIYGFAQCTRDLSGVSCAECIDFATQSILNNAYAKLGARFFGESCNVQYEMDPFLLA